MEIYLSYRLRACLAAVIFGAATGVFYDVLRICYLAFGVDLSMKRHRKISYAVCIIFDVLYSVAVTVGFSVLTYAFSSGKPRFEVFTCAIIGFAAYYMSIGRVIMLFAGQIVFLLKKILGLTLRWVVFPFLLAIRLLKPLLKAVYVKTIGAGIKKIILGICKVRLNRTMAKKLPDSVRL